MFLNSALSAFLGFDPNHWVMYLMYALIVAFVSGEAIFYLVKSIRKAKELGMDMAKIKKIITTSTTFSILPAVGIGIGVVALIGSLGIAFPAIRLSVIGALQYESQMADGAAVALSGSMDNLIASGVTAEAFATMAMLMTVSIILGPILVVLFYKKLQPMLTKLSKIEVGGKPNPDATQALEADVKKKNPARINIGDLVFQVAFIGMIVGYLAWAVGKAASAPASIGSYYNLIAVIIAALVMLLSEFLIKKFNWKWLDSLSTPFAMLFAMLIVAIISGTTGVY